MLGLSTSKPAHGVEALPRLPSPNSASLEPREEARERAMKRKREVCGSSLDGGLKQEVEEVPSSSNELEEGSCVDASSGSLYTDKSLDGAGGVSVSEEDSGRESLSREKGKLQVKDEPKAVKKALQGETDIFGQFLLYQPTDLVQCKRCGRSTIAGKFAMHLSRCMGYGRSTKNL